jgi:lactoylglutathione lyase
MKVNHLNLTVTDVQAPEQFLVKYFGLQSQGGTDRMIMLFDDNGLRLTLSKGGQKIRYPGSFHIGLIQESEEQVSVINQRMKEDGLDVKSPQKYHAWTFYVQAPGGFTVEVLS